MEAAGDDFFLWYGLAMWQNWEEWDCKVHLLGGMVEALPVYPHTPHYTQLEKFSDFQEKDA